MTLAANMGQQIASVDGGIGPNDVEMKIIPVETKAEVTVDVCDRERVEQRFINRSIATTSKSQ